MTSKDTRLRRAIGFLCNRPVYGSIDFPLAFPRRVELLCTIIQNRVQVIIINLATSLHFYEIDEEK